jgi:RND family efflux transporter MFP subunit
VPAGTILMKLRSTEQRAGLQQAEAARAEAVAREAEAQARFARIRDMHERKVVAKAQLDQVAAERDAAVARLAAATAAVESAREGVAYTEVRAPYAGIVTERLVRVGESVSPGTPLMRGLSLEKLRVNVDIPQTLVEQVRSLRKAAVYVDGRRIEATGVTIFPEADPATNTFRARVDLPANAADLYPGMFVKVGFVTGESPRLLVPATAIVARSEVTAVYVVDGEGRISLRQVRTGGAVGDRLEILAGLAAGERVALDPVAALRSMTPPAPGDNG